MLSRDEIRSEAATLAKAHKLAVIVPTGLDNLAGRLEREPQAYLQFGAFWWGIKAMLRTRGHDLGPADDPEAFAMFGFGADTPEWLDYVAGFLHQRYRAFYPSPVETYETRDGEREQYRLSDPDMDRRYMGSPIVGRTL